MLHFKQLSNSSAPPPHRKTSLPPISKPKRQPNTELLLLQKDHPHKYWLSFISFLHYLPCPSLSHHQKAWTTHPAAHLVHVLHAAHYLLSKGKCSEVL